MTRFVTTDDMTLVLNRTYALGKAAEAAQRISADLDEDKQNIKVADESVDRGQKRLRKGNLTKKQRGKIERTIEYHQELMWCTQRQCEKRDPKFSEAIAQVESVLRDLAEIYDGLAKVPRFEHAERDRESAHGYQAGGWKKRSTLSH
jgi:lipopolysaccharide biosynthesis regulator YciM